MSAPTIGDLIEKADAVEESGDYGGALSIFKEALERIDETSDLEADLDDNEDVLSGLAKCNFALGRYSDAELFYSRLLKLQQGRHGNDDEVAQTRYDLAQSLVKLHEYGRAIPLYRQYLLKQVREHGKYEVLARHNLAYALCRHFKFVEASKLDQENLVVLETKGKTGSDAGICQSRYQLGMNLYYLQDFEHAEEVAKDNIGVLRLAGDLELQSILTASKKLAAACKQKISAQQTKTPLKRSRVSSTSTNRAEEIVTPPPPTASLASTKKSREERKRTIVPQSTSQSSFETATPSKSPKLILPKDANTATTTPLSKPSTPRKDSDEKRGRSSLSLPSTPRLDKSGSRRSSHETRSKEIPGRDEKRATHRSTSISGDTKTFGSYYTVPGTEFSQLDADMADGWFNDYAKSTLAIFQDATTTGSGRRFIKPPADKVKIAIIDSGVSMQHPDIKPHSRRIHVKSFVGGPGSGILSAEEDLTGHGTHSALIMLAMVPHAEIYVARTGGEKGPQPNDVAEAIKWAHKEERVDIISMAFGYPENVRDESTFTDMETAIRDAHRDDVLLFAAAANHGASRAAAFPANMNEVICINSTNAGGVQSAFNPQTSHADRVFAILGERVKPPVLGKRVKPDGGQPEDQRKSGTSTAVTVAAGVAGVILYLVKSRDPREDRVKVMKKRVKTMQGMCHILRWLSVKRSARENGGEWIVPWQEIDIMKSHTYNSNTYKDDMAIREPIRKEIFDDMAKYLRNKVPGRIP